jgi:hypothetical protein
MKKFLIIISAVMFLFGMTGMAYAGYLDEIEPNDSLAGAMNIDPYFTTWFQPDIDDDIDPLVWPWVSINSDHGDGTFDYFKFTVPEADVQGYFDVDYGHNYGGSTDTIMGLWASDGTLLAQNDDRGLPIDDGSYSQWDAHIDYTFDAAGVYIIGLAEVSGGSSTPAYGGFTAESNPFDYDDDYVLQVGLTNAVPIPGAVWLLGSGILGLIGIRRKKVIAHS